MTDTGPVELVAYELIVDADAVAAEQAANREAIQRLIRDRVWDLDASPEGREDA